ncbi:unnamed protein product [Schistocephalus solidus]|uniref:Nucleolar protein 56 n=1 Tax=Schistocephalus solidus TaxID=70667 RepID=A0A183T7U9_SCHSO|nr:unnamed protein product [Schistocephalus solidus]
MGTKQHFVLFENVSGYSLFLIKEFDEIVRRFSAHPNAFLKPTAFVPFGSVVEALENVQYINEGRVSKLLRNFLRQNLPIKDAILGVADERLGSSILALDLGFECIWDAAMREIIRIIRANSSRLLRSLMVQPGAASRNKAAAALTGLQEIAPGKQAEHRSRLIVALSRARLQLDLLQHLADTGVVRSLGLLDSMDNSLGSSVKRLKAAYALHFPELCRDQQTRSLDDFTFISIIANFPNRDGLLRARNDIPGSIDKLAEWTGNRELAENILVCASTSTGQDLAEEDLTTLQTYAHFLLKLLQSRKKCCEMLERRVRSLLPNLTALMDRVLPTSQSSSDLEHVRRVGDSVSSVLVVARLLSHAVTLDRLARMSASRVNSLGASKSLFRRTGVVAATNSGLLGTVAVADSLAVAPDSSAGNSSRSITEMSGGRLRPIVVRRRITRILAAKSALASRADCFQRMNPFQAGSDAVYAVPQHLTTGEYGSSLGDEAKRQLRVWAEANGVQFGRSDADFQRQRENRKKYRKQKRKGWLRRKLKGAKGGCVTVPLAATPAAVVSEVEKTSTHKGKTPSGDLPRLESSEDEGSEGSIYVTDRIKRLDSRLTTPPTERKRPAESSPELSLSLSSSADEKEETPVRPQNTTKRRRTNENEQTTKAKKSTPLTAKKSATRRNTRASLLASERKPVRSSPRLLNSLA